MGKQVCSARTRMRQTLTQWLATLGFVQQNRFGRSIKKRYKKRAKQRLLAFWVVCVDNSECPPRPLVSIRSGNLCSEQLADKPGRKETLCTKSWLNPNVKEQTRRTH